MEDQHLITTFEQLKAISDPLRSRILAVLSRGAMTTLQVAREMGEKPTRLYHHVEILQSAGLIRAVREHRKRGTVERYLEPIARVFVVSSALLNPPDAADPANAADTSRQLVEGVLEQTAAELRQRIGEGMTLHERSRMKLARLLVRGGEPQIARLLDAIGALIDQASGLAEERGERGAPVSEFRLQLAFYPLGPLATDDEASTPPEHLQS